MVASKKTQNVRQGLSKNESLLLSALSEKGKKIFGLEDVIEELDRSYAYAKDIANNLVRKKWIINLRRGAYLIVPLSAGVDSKYTEHEFVIGSHLVSPYYIAYWNALNFYNLTEQTPFTVFIATTKRAKSRVILDTKYNFVTLNKKKFFGFAAVSVGPDKVNISDREKTLADALDQPQYCGGISELAKCLWNAKEVLDIERIVSYAERMGNLTIIKRLGYISEALGLGVDEKVLSEMKTKISSGMSILDPTMPHKGKHSTRWNLHVNVSKESLSKWREEF